MENEQITKTKLSGKKWEMIVESIIICNSKITKNIYWGMEKFERVLRNDKNIEECIFQNFTKSNNWTVQRKISIIGLKININKTKYLTKDKNRDQIADNNI